MKILRMKNAIKAKSALDEKEDILRMKTALQDAKLYKPEEHLKTPPNDQILMPIQPAEKIMYIFCSLM